jgi:hypothetical protein
MLCDRGDLLVGVLHCFFESRNQSTSLFLKMEPIATSAFVVFLDMSRIDAGSFKQAQINGKVFYDFENFTGRVGTRLFVTEGSQSIEIGRSEDQENNTPPAGSRRKAIPTNKGRNAPPGSHKAVPTNKKGSGKRGPKKMSAAALSILDEASSSSNDSGLAEDSDDTEVLKERLKALRNDESVRFTEKRSEDEESEFKSEEEESSEDEDSAAEESSKEEDSAAEESSKEESEKEDPSEEQGGGSEDEGPSNEHGDNEGKEASEDDEGRVEEESSKKQGDIERKEASEEEGEEDKASNKQQGDSKQEQDNGDGDNGGDNEGTWEDFTKKVPINYSAWKKKDLEMECRLRDLTSDGRKAILIERLQENDQRMMNDEDELVTEHDEDNGQDEAVPEKRTSHRRNARRH